MSTAEAAAPWRPGPVPRAILGAAGAAFLGIGAAFLLAPADLAAQVDLTGLSVTARSDVRAVFGGLELGLGAFLAVCALRARWVAAGLLCQLFCFSGMVVARLLGLFQDGTPWAFTFVLLAAEIVGAGAAVYAIRRLPPRRRPFAREPVDEEHAA